MSSETLNPRLRRAVAIVAFANLCYFVVEFVVARSIGSVSLLADSVDFLEDFLANSIIAIALGWSLKKRARVGMLLSGVLLIPALALFWTAWQKFHSLTPPDPWMLSVTGIGALLVNLGCAFLLAKYRHHRGSLARAAFLSARNDALANIAIIVAGLVTFQFQSGWPDLIVGVGIALMNADAAKEVWLAARDEHSSAKA